MYLITFFGKLIRFHAKILVLCCMLLGIATSYTQQNKKDSLVFKLKHLESTNRFNPKDTTHIKLLVKLAFAYRYANNDSAYSISKKALKLSEAVNFECGKINALEAMANYYSDQGNGKEAIALFKKALQLAKKN